MPKITVITPVYNGEKYISAALDSLIPQSEADWDLIVVNDGSTDSTGRILAGYQDPRITILSQPNAGESAARNAGLDRADGTYIAFLDADDMYLPDALKAMSTYLDGHPGVDVVFSDGHLCDESGKPLTRLTQHRPGIHQGHILEPLVLDSAVVTVPVCTMTRREAITSSGARFDRSLVIGPDWDFWIQLAVGHSFGYLDQLTCMYRVHQTNITKTSGLEKRLADLVRGRSKVMQADWFPSLSAATRKKFFYHLLVDLLGGQTSRQVEILESSQLKTLDLHDQAHLWRLAGMDTLKRGTDPVEAVRFFTRAREIEPRAARTDLLLRLSTISPGAARAAVITWDWAARLRKSIRNTGKPAPKPVPIQITTNSPVRKPE